MRKYSVAIIGLGSIGQGYDYADNEQGTILTHANGFSSDSRFELVAAVDPDQYQQKRFEAKYSRPAYPSIDSLMSEQQPEVFSIASSTESHFQIFQELIPHQPIGLLCEKPLANTLEDANKMVELARMNQCSLVVNYSRRFYPATQTLKELIQQGELGKIYKGTIWYTKGFRNNASHFIDLLAYLFGDVTHVEILDAGRKWGDYDQEPDVCLHFSTLKIYVLSGRHECFSLNEMVLFGTAGMVRYEGAEIRINKTRKDPLIAENSVLSEEHQVIPADGMRLQKYVIDALYQKLAQNVSPASDGESAVKTLSIIEQVAQSCGF
jgi:predicted dehydrogenase